MEFVLVTLGMIGFIVGVLVLVGRAYPGSGADLLDWKPTRDYEAEVQLEQDDVAQMLAAQNEYRRRRGASELTTDDAERMAREDNRVRERARFDQASLAEIDEELGENAGREEDAGLRNHARRGEDDGLGEDYGRGENQGRR